VIKVICLDENYSTTRLVTKEKPEIINTPEDKFETVLFVPDGEDRKGEGGLRTKGYFKKSYEYKPLISIITVVFNGEKYLEETIQSVINQTYDNVEYIIIDGGSTDETLDIIKKYENQIDYWVSERDDGIYDAMNKGIDLASGEWINFMNAGDSFYDENIIKKVFFESKIEDFHVIYGNTLVKYSDSLLKNINAPAKLNFNTGLPFCHQSSFVKGIIQKKFKFSSLYSIYADYNFFIEIYQNNVNFLYMNLTVSKFDYNGISSVKSLKHYMELIKILNKSNMNISYSHFVNLIIRNIIKKILPKDIIEYIRKLRK